MQSNNHRITIEKKIKAIEYAINMKSNYIAADKFWVSEWTIWYEILERSNRKFKKDQ